MASFDTTSLLLIDETLERVLVSWPMVRTDSDEHEETHISNHAYDADAWMRLAKVTPTELTRAVEVIERASFVVAETGELRSEVAAYLRKRVADRLRGPRR